MPAVKRPVSHVVDSDDDDDASTSNFSAGSSFGSNKGAAAAPVTRATGSSQRGASGAGRSSPSRRASRKNKLDVTRDDDHHKADPSSKRSKRRRTMLIEHDDDNDRERSSLRVLEPTTTTTTTTTEPHKRMDTLSASSSTTIDQDDLGTNHHNDDSATTDSTEPGQVKSEASPKIIEPAIDRKGKNTASNHGSIPLDHDQDELISKSEVRLRVQRSMAAWAKEKQAFEEKIKARNAFIDQQAELLTQLTQFSDSLQATAACAICLQTMKAPHALGCGHVFCRQCLINCFFSANNQDDDDDDDDDNDDDDDDDEISSPSGSGYSSHSDSDSESETGNDTSILSVWEADQPPPPPEGMETIRLTVGNRSFQMDRPEPGSSTARATAEDASDRFVELDSDDDDDEQGLGAIGAARERMARVERIERASLRHRSPRENDSTSPPASPGRAPAAGFGAEDSMIIEDEEVHRAGPVPPMVRPRPHPSNVICPSCRTKVDTAPKRIFALTDLIHRIRQAEQEGLIGDLDDPAPPKSDANKAGASDGMEVSIDENDKTWGGLFMETGVGGNTNGRTRAARDRDDGVRRCPDCSWEIIEATGECSHCQRVYDLSSDEDFQRRPNDSGAESDDGSDISVGSMPRHGAPNGREEDEEEEPNSEDEAFIDDAPIPKRRREQRRAEGASSRRSRRRHDDSSDDGSGSGSDSDSASDSLSSESDSDSDSAVSTSSSRHSDSTQHSSEAPFPDEGRDAQRRRRKARREARRVEEKKERRKGRGKEVSEEEEQEEEEDESVIIEEESHESARKAAARAAIRRAEKKGISEEGPKASAKATTSASASASTSTSANVDKGSNNQNTRKGWRKLPKIIDSDDDEEE